MTMKVTVGKDKRAVEEVFTPAGKGYRVNCGTVVLPKLSQAVALIGIIHSFETSATKRGNGGKPCG